MAEDIWHIYPHEEYTMTDKRYEITEECYRQAENCLYTSTTLYLWLRILRIAKTTFIVLPLVLGGVGAWKLLTTNDVVAVRNLASACAFLAGLLPTIYTALKFDDSLESVARNATSFKVQQDEFRQLALIHAHDLPEDYQRLFDLAMVKMNAARSVALTPPDWVFKMAQRKIKSGDYAFDHDEKIHNKE